MAQIDVEVSEDSDESRGSVNINNLYTKLGQSIGMTQRVFKLQILRPFYGFDVEKRYRNVIEPLNAGIRDAKKNDDKINVKNIERKKKDAIVSFFSAEKEKNPSMFTLDDMYFSFKHFSYIASILFNKTASEIFLRKQRGEKIGNMEKILKEVLLVPFNYNNKEYNLSSLFPKGSGCSDFFTGLIQNKIKGAFTKKKSRMYSIGEMSIPNAKKNFPIPFYFSAAKKTTLVKFYGVDYTNEKLSNDPDVDYDDYVIVAKIPYLHPTEKWVKSSMKSKKKVNGNEEDEETESKIVFLERFDALEFISIPFIINTRNLLGKVRDGSTNQIIKDFISGKIEMRVNDFIESRMDEIVEFVNSADLRRKNGEFLDIEDAISKTRFKWSHVSSYEIVNKMMNNKPNAYFFHLTYNVIPKVLTSKSEDRIAGIDFGFSKNTIMAISVVDTKLHDENSSRIESWIIDSMMITNKDYHLREIYDDFYRFLRGTQRGNTRSRKTGDSISKNQIKFHNKRKYFIGKTISDIVKFCVKNNVSLVNVENLKSLRSNETRFAIHKIRNFPMLEMFDKLESKLKGEGIAMKRVSPAYTSRMCPICGKVNNSFTFDYRMENQFPIFTCLDKTCRYGKDEPTSLEKFRRNADINASLNISLKNDSFIHGAVNPENDVKKSRMPLTKTINETKNKKKSSKLI